MDPTNSNRIIDVRYSFVPNEISALFSIEIAHDVGLNKHVRYKTHRDRAHEQFYRLWMMIINQLP